MIKPDTVSVQKNQNQSKVTHYQSDDKIKTIFFEIIQ